VEIPQCRLGKKKQVLCGVVLAPVGANCYLACHRNDVGEVLSFYQQRVWIEEQNRDELIVSNSRKCFNMQEKQAHIYGTNVIL
jgi:hypothetical protein